MTNKHNKIKYNLFVLGLLFIFFISCNDNSKPYLPKYIGQQGEIIVISEQHHWTSAIGENIRTILSRTQYGLPQDEPIFNLVHISPQSFLKAIQKHRNILIVNVTDKEKYKNGLIEVRKNKWAKGQMLITVSAQNALSWIKIFSQNKEKIINYFQQIERDRIITKNEKYGEKMTTKMLLKNHHLSLFVPEKSFIAKQTENFIWIRREQTRLVSGISHQISQGVMVYYYDYTNDSTFTRNYLLSVRDSLTKQFISGPSNGSYMSTYYDDYPPTIRETKLNKNYAVELRGLWKVEGDFMGGPFVSLTTLDEKRNRIITVEGYVFAPKFDKREYLREVEAVIYSLELF